MGERRGIEKSIPRIGINTAVEIWPTFGGTKTTEIGQTFTRYEFGAMLNAGEYVRAVVQDPFYTLNNALIGSNYFTESRPDAPNIIYTTVGWAGFPELKVAETEHSLVAVSPIGANTSSQEIEFLAVDHGTICLAGGDGGGRCWKGKISTVIKDVVDEFGQGVVQAEFEGQTKDNEHNRWYQNRMSPRTFIAGLLEWSTVLADQKTRWLIWPVGGKLQFKEQAQVQSKHRSTYYWRGYGKGQPGPADILEWELLANNSLQFCQNEFVTYGMSAVSGSYYDDKMDKDKKIVRVRRQNTNKQFSPRVENGRTFSNVGDAEPDSTPAVGWTLVPSVPELNAGDLGVPYEDWVSGYARGHYLKTAAGSLRARFRVTGHHIWGGSEGLGVDTFDTVIMTAEGKAHFLQGNWIIYGFKHIATRQTWYTDLFGYRLDIGAGKQVGK